MCINIIIIILTLLSCLFSVTASHFHPLIIVCKSSHRMLPFFSILYFYRLVFACVLTSPLTIYVFNGKRSVVFTSSHTHFLLLLIVIPLPAFYSFLLSLISSLLPLIFSHFSLLSSLISIYAESTAARPRQLPIQRSAVQHIWQCGDHHREQHC